MPALQVREMPDELYDRLKNSAKMNHRSLSQETVCMLESKLMPPRLKDSCMDSEIQKRNQRIEERRRAFEELECVNCITGEFTSTEINDIIESSRNEFESRIDLSELKIGEVH